jgi:dephospho-CoA kinase
MATPSLPVLSRSDPSTATVSAVRFRVGLTGGIGSGKSLIADEFARLGAHVVDTDAIAHALTAPGGDAIEPIRARFGSAFIDKSGALDRARMRALVFRDTAARRALEGILHPLVRGAAEADAERAPLVAAYLVLVIPLLIESRTWESRVNRVLVIDCAIESQLARLQRRSGLDESSAQAIIASQATRAERLNAADDILVNESSTAAARGRVARLHALYGQLARREMRHSDRH